MVKWWLRSTLHNGPRLHDIPKTIEITADKHTSARHSTVIFGRDLINKIYHYSDDYLVIRVDYY